MQHQRNFNRNNQIQTSQQIQQKLPAQVQTYTQQNQQRLTNGTNQPSQMQSQHVPSIQSQPIHHAPNQQLPSLPQQQPQQQQHQVMIYVVAMT